MIDRYPLTIEDKRRIFFFRAKAHPDIAGWSSLVARRAHNPEVVGSNPAPATKHYGSSEDGSSDLSFECPSECRVSAEHFRMVA